MKLYFRFFVFLALIFAICFSLNAQPKPQEFEIGGANGEWFVDSENRINHAKMGEFLGRKSLMIKKGSHILKSNVEFTNGTIEFDVAPLSGAQFIVVMLRRGNSRNYENIYLRPSQSGRFQALQYAPVINGSSTWQIYPEFMRTINLPKNKWTNVKIDVNGSNLKIFINKSTKPNLEVTRLRGIPKKGAVGFWGVVSDRKSDAWSAAFSNFSITPRTSSKTTANRPKLPIGILDSWQVAKPLENKKGGVMTIPNLDEWKNVEAEESGLINLNRAVGSPRGRWTAYAKTNIKSNKAKRTLLKFGYSDDVTIFLNGKPIFSGVNGWESRYPQYMGLMKLGNDSVFLDLKKGNNELIFAVTNRRFGWGFVAQMKEMP